MVRRFIGGAMYTAIRGLLKGCAKGMQTEG